MFIFSKYEPVVESGFTYYSAKISRKLHEICLFIDPPLNIGVAKPKPERSNTIAIHLTS